MKVHHTILSIIGTLTLASCGDPGKETARQSEHPDKPQVYATNYPLKWFADKMAGSAANVVYPAPPDEDPAFWKPADDVVAAFQEADLILMNGATYSKWADKVTLPSSKIVDTSAGFAPNFIVTQGEVTHSHGPGGAHSHSGTAFTTWLDLQQGIQQAAAVRDALQKLIPAQKDQITERFNEIKATLESLDQRLLAVGKRINNAPIVASHPIYQYLARRYGINLKPMLWEPEVVPDDKAMTDLQTLIATHPAKWMIWEGEPAAESVAKLKAIGIESVVFDPCGNTPDSGDFIS
ncbi:MAG: zinc ABC transporter substrate-binding protein, partial [Verrucomicrobiales bacterium]|nr:zinc ABC transporter substrate-binding protein [Verrucomicrobiales bacterium]